jgi:P63C domain.
MLAICKQAGYALVASKGVPVSRVSQEKKDTSYAASEISPQQKGGEARARRLSPEERQEIARQGARARWSALRSAPDADLPRATHAGERPVGGYIIQVYNLEDQRRIISERGFLALIGAKGAGGAGNKLIQLLSDPVIRAFIPKSAITAIENPILFVTPSNSRTYGYPSGILSDFCIGFSKARAANALTSKIHINYALHCETLLYAFAEVGIDAWIDEATGFQQVRARDAINKLLEKYLAKHWAQWAKTFPDEYYEQVFRLRGWKYEPEKLARPGVLGHITNDIVYSRLAPGVLDALREKNPVIEETGRRVRKHHQWLSRDYGHPKLKEHIGNLIFMMRGHTNWQAFHRALQRAAPRLHETPEFDFGEY